MVAEHFLELYLKAVESRDLELIKSIDELFDKKSIDIHSKFRGFTYGFEYDKKYLKSGICRYLDTKIKWYKYDFSPIVTAIYLNDISLLNYFLFEKKYVDLLKKRITYEWAINYSDGIYEIEEGHYPLLELATSVGHIRMIKLFLDLSNYPKGSLVYCIRNVINTNHARKMNKNKMKEILLLFTNYLPYSLIIKNISFCKYDKIIKDVTKYAKERHKTILSLIIKRFRIQLPLEIQAIIFSFIY